MKKMLNTKLSDYRLNANWEYEKKIAELAQKQHAIHFDGDPQENVKKYKTKKKSEQKVH